MYSLEPQLRDIYVEGITDKIIIERFLVKNNIKDCKVIEIDGIEFTAFYQESPELKRNNKLKLVRLTEELSSNTSVASKLVCAIADRDYDDCFKRIKVNPYLIYTDFTSIEMYLFNENCIEIFYKNIFHNFPVSPKKTLENVQNILIHLFFIRLVIKSHNEINDDFKFVDVKKSISIDKSSGKISFEWNSHLRKILHAYGLSKKFSNYEKSMNEIIINHPITDPRFYIRGHDFVHLLFIYTNSLKKIFKSGEDIFERAFFQCLDYSRLKDYSLFKTLLSKYSI